MLITNLIEFGEYRLANVVCGWETSCPICEHVMRGKIWEFAPKKCQNPHKCQAPIDDQSITEIPFRADRL
ncbi:hypothetical protein PUN4_780050 [Paraburkholderia unamae]|nr:hypothetical protein PUN4_780050 [Paraburkholderia unamae]